MGFEQAQISVVQVEQYRQLIAALEQAFAPSGVEKFLSQVQSRGIRVRDFAAVLGAGLLEKAAGLAKGKASELYNALAVSDQALIREAYLTRVEQVDDGIREKFSKIYRYY